jgi:hypothetical protein
VVDGGVVTSPLVGLTLRDRVVAAIQAVGATEEMVAAVVGVFVARGAPHPSRKYESAAARQRAYRKRKRDVTPAECLAPRDVTDGRNLRVRLIDASNGNIDALADISPIRALIEQGCDLEADVVPVVARLIPELPRPLKNWGAPSLVRDILAARDQPADAPPTGAAEAMPSDSPYPAERFSDDRKDAVVRVLDDAAVRVLQRRAQMRESRGAK